MTTTMDARLIEARRCVVFVLHIPRGSAVDRASGCRRPTARFSGVLTAKRISGFRPFSVVPAPIRLPAIRPSESLVGSSPSLRIPSIDFRPVAAPESDLTRKPPCPFHENFIGRRYAEREAKCRTSGTRSASDLAPSFGRSAI
jgi:hypothetical protein